MSKLAPRPGESIHHANSSLRITLGAYALHSCGDIVWSTCAHGVAYLEDKRVANRGDPIVTVRRRDDEMRWDPSKRVKVNGKEFRLGTTNLSSLRIRGICEMLPAVLKKPREVEQGEEVFKSGAVTGMTQGKVTHCSSKKEIDYGNCGRGRANFVDLIRTTRMAKAGDSGSLLLAKTDLAPVGIVTAVMPRATYHSKATNVVSLLPITGFYCPMALPSDSTLLLACVANDLIWDGMYEQVEDITTRSTREVLDALGASVTHSGDGQTVRYENLVVVGMPFVRSDVGNILEASDRRAMGVIVSGDRNRCYALPITRVLDAFRLSLVSCRPRLT